jgi:LPPG:FO 2-phospho-L-lactate transferase
VREVRDALASASAFRVAVSPLVGGRSLKGPSDRMMRAKGFSPDAVGVAKYYKGLIDAMVIDEADQLHKTGLEEMGLKVRVTQTVMKSMEDRRRLAREILEWAG